MNKLSLTLGVSALTLGLALTGCSAGTPSPTTDNNSSSAPATSASLSDANTGDVMFVTMMIPHHQQAIEMSDIVLGKEGLDPRVADLAQQIKEAQGPEIERMLGWLEDWGVEYDPDSMGGMDHGGMDGMGGMDHGGMDGMMSEDDMTALEEADGPEASKLFLEQMIAHHEGAVDMARVALDDAQNPEVLALAQQVIDDQTAEVTVMRDLLGDL